MIFFPGGSGVPPGTRPESCKRCRGSGMVSFPWNWKIRGLNEGEICLNSCILLYSDIHAIWPIQDADNLCSVCWNWENICGMVHKISLLSHSFFNFAFTLCSCCFIPFYCIKEMGSWYKLVRESSLWEEYKKASFSCFWFLSWFAPTLLHTLLN